MELQDYLAILWRRKWVIVITIIVTEIVVIVGTLLTTPTYSATATLRIATAANGAVNYSDYMYADRLLNTYVQISTTKPVLDELKRRLSLINLPQIEVKTIPNTELIQISVEYKDPTLAANITNTLADILVSQSAELYMGGGKSSLDILSEQVTRMEDEVNQARIEYLDLVAKNPGDTAGIQAAKQAMDLKQQIYVSTLDQYEQSRLREALRANSISITDPAVPPLSPSKPRKVLNITLGFLIGSIGGLGLAFLFENLDSTLYTAEQIENVTKLPALGSIPNVEIQTRMVANNGSNPYGEAFLRLRANIHSLNQDTPISTLVVTSPEPGEGKSTIATNLAIALAKSGQKVVIVDCDMRIPTQHRIWKLPNNKGLSKVLMQESDLEDAIQETSIPMVQVLTSGPLPRNPSELLGSPQMDGIIELLRQRFDTVIFDSPSILEVTDAAVLAPNVDGVLLVVNRARSRKENVRAACKQLIDVKANTIGVVINRAEHNGSYYYKKR